MGDIKEIEKIQKKATELIIHLENISYTDTLLHLILPTLKYKRLPGDNT